MKNHRDRKKREPKDNERKTRLKVLEPIELMIFLKSKITGQSHNKIKSLLSHGQVLVDGKAVNKYNHLLEPGQEVIINWSQGSVSEEVEIPKIIYEDADLIVIDKPAGLLTIASDTQREHTAYNQLTNYVRKTDINNRIFIVHRLDKDTSGVMLFAKNEDVKKLFQNNWKELIEERVYIAVVVGAVRKKEDTIKSWLLETKTQLMYSSFKPGKGQEAITHYKVLQNTANYSLLEIRLETGRKNQIRVHMKDIGHSIIGDKKYGAKTNPIGRMALHAKILTFYHPTKKERMHFESEIPKNFLALFK